MKKLSQFLVLGFAATATIFTTLAPAEAGHRNWRHHHSHRGNGDALAAGVIGLAAGAIIGGALADSRNDRRVYVEPAPTYYPPAPQVYRPAPVYQPAPVYRPVSSGYQPWSAGWYDYCSSRYRSFDPSSGTFVGYDGQERFCVAN